MGKSKRAQEGAPAIRPLALSLLLLLIGTAIAVSAQRAQAAPAQEPDQELNVTLRKTVGTTPGVCATTEEITVAPGATVYICYTLSNVAGAVAIDPLDLIDNFGLDNFQPVTWNKPPGYLLEPGAVLQGSADNGLIRAVTVDSDQNSYASWGVASADGAARRQVDSNPVTIKTVTLEMTAALGVSTTPGATAANCSLPAVTLSSYANLAYLCVTLTNNSTISLTQHQITIPGFNINVTVNKELGAKGTAAAVLRLTNTDAPELAVALTAPSLTSRAFITSINAANTLTVSAASEPVAVTGPAAAVNLIKTPNTDPINCAAATTLTNVPYGQQFYYCLVLINPSPVTFTNHVFTDPGVGLAASLDFELAPNSRITITNNYLTSTLGVAPVLGPFEAKQIINSTLTYTASNPTLGFRAVTSASSSVNIITPTPTATRGPTATNTPIPFDTPIPTPTLTPIPATPTPTWTWTPSPTVTPIPTVLLFSTPGGAVPTPYPALPGVQAGGQPNPFVSPLDPFVATQTAQAQFGFPTPVLDPFAATQTAQAQFAFPTPILDPFAATQTAQAQFGFPTPVLDPVGATATAQALYAFPTPILDPFAATQTAQAQFGFPTPLLDPVGATLTAQFFSPLPTPSAAAAAVLPPALVITVTATFTPEPLLTPTQRPLEPVTPGPTADTQSLFVRILDSAGATVALLWFLGGSVLFFVTAGVLAGLSFRAKERSRFVLDPDAEQSAFTATETEQDDHWPASLP